MTEQGPHLTRYLVRQGIKGWMVWDRQLRGPARIERRLTRGLTEEQAQQIKDELTTAAAQSSTSPQPKHRTAKVRKLRNRLGGRMRCSAAVGPDSVDSSSQHFERSQPGGGATRKDCFSGRA